MPSQADPENDSAAVLPSEADATTKDRKEDREDLANARENTPVASVAKPFWRCLGPGLITGAADDDPSGIGTYSVTGAQFGYLLLWLVYYGHPDRPSLSQVTLMPPRFWRDHPDPEVRRFYGKLNRYSQVWLESLGVKIPNIWTGICADGEIVFPRPRTLPNTSIGLEIPRVRPWQKFAYVATSTLKKRFNPILEFTDK